MRSYRYRCQSCGWETDQSQYSKLGEHADFPCQSCGGLLRRIVGTFSTASSFEPHFNYSVGCYVNNERQFRDALKHRSEDAFLQTGQESNLIPVDPADVPSMGVTDEGMDETRKQQHDGLWTP